MIKVIFTVIIMLMGNAIIAQDSLLVFVNKKAAAKFISGQEAVSFSLKKAGAAKAKNICIQLKTDKINPSPYKQSIEITDSKESQSNTIDITANNFAKKDITALLKKYNFFKGQHIKIFLLLNPANKMMMMPSKRIYLGELTIH